MILVPALHPAALIRSAGGSDDTLGLAKFEQTCLADFAKALRMVRERPDWDERAIWERDSAGRLKNLYPTPDEVIEFCRSARGHLLAVDTETTGESPLDCRMICVGMASATGRVMCVPILNKGGGYYWSQYDAQRVGDALRELFAAHDTPKVAHNYVFDSIVLWSHGLPLGGIVEDTMQMHHVIDSELPHGLGYCGTRYLDVRYWKDDVKGDEGWLGLENETLRSYNLRDCLVTLRLVPIFARELSTMGLWDLYREEVALAGLMGRATVRGLPIDYVRRDGGVEWDHGSNGKPAQWQQIRGLGPVLVEQMNTALATLRGLSGNPAFDPLKPVALRDLMFGKLGLPVVKLSKSGLLPSTDKEAMVLLALAADTDVQRAAIKALADFKSAHKAKSTFVDGLPILGDQRLHVFWKLLTTTGRFSSSPNAQNWNKKIKKIFGWGVSPGGFLPTRRFVGVDLAQAEMRGIGYLAPSQRFLDMYAKDLNVHTINASIALRVRPRLGHKDMDVATEQYLREQIPLLIAGGSYDTLTEIGNDDSWKTTRTLIKKDGFGRNYGADDDTVFRIERSDRDPETNELSFPFLTKSDVEANGIRWRKMNFEIVSWWDKVQKQVKLAGKYVCPVSGRIRWFRAGFKRTDILGTPNQTLIASIVNKRMLEIQAQYDRETGGDCLIVQQVHDALNADCHMDYAADAGKIMQRAFDHPVALPGFPNARFPADKPAIGFHLDEV